MKNGFSREVRSRRSHSCAQGRVPSCRVRVRGLWQLIGNDMTRIEIHRYGTRTTFEVTIAVFWLTSIWNGCSERSGTSCLQPALPLMASPTPESSEAKVLTTAIIKHHISPSSNSVSSLPPELWRIIFAFAVRPCAHVSSALDASDSGRSLDPLALAVAATHPTVLRTKLAFLLVCKHWHRTARDILYEHVIFKSYESLTRCLAALVNLGSDTSPFYSTQSLVLYLYDWKSWNIPIVKILKLCDNLRTLVLGIYSQCFRYSSDGMRLVINAIPSNLVALAYIGEYTESMMETLSSFQTLEYLSILPSYPVCPDRSTCRPVFPHVRHITLSHDNSEGWGSYFPEARHLSIVISRAVHLPDNIDAVDQSKVEYLSIATKTWFPKYMRFNDIILASFMQGFQNLIILSYNPFTLNVSGSHPFETHPTLQSVRHYIEIPNVNHNNEDVDEELQTRFQASWMQSWNWLHCGADKFPNLKSIVGVYKCKGANDREENLLRFIKGLGGYDPKLTFACTLQCKEI